MIKNEIIDQIIESLTELKSVEDIEITNFSQKPEIESWEMVDGTGYDYLSYQFTIKLKQPKKFKIIGGIKEYVNNKGEKNENNNNR